MSYQRNRFYFNLHALFILIVVGLTISSCEKDYYYDTREPDFLNGSIYEYLEKSGDFKYYVRLINDLGYKEVLALTGSKTLFVSKDEAFDRFFQDNEWGVSSYEELSVNQKKMLFYFSMINNAYTLEKLSNYYDGQFNEGLALRRLTALSAIDRLSFDTELPAGPYWDPYRENGLYILKDNTDIPFIFFSQQFIDRTGMTDDDFTFLSGGKIRVKDDFYVFDNKVIEKDIVCKNGFIQIMEDVLTPPDNMAEYITGNEKMSIFAALLNRFSAPFYDHQNTLLYRELNPEFTDSIFNKRYFAVNGGVSMDPDGKPVPLLAFNPGWNAYVTTSSIYSDMAAMFVPTDEAMTYFFNNEPIGMLLKERYQTWENLPNEVVVSFLKRHMRPSLIESFPHNFDKMVDDQNYPMQVVEADIVKEENYTAINGQVYVTNKVFTPVDFISVYGPVLLSEDSRVMNWAIRRTETATDGSQFAFYQLYLNSLVVNYSLFIPSDGFFNSYVDPVAFGQDGIQGAMKYWYNEETKAVNATIYEYSKATHEIGDSIAAITDAGFIQNRLWKLLDSHIVVGDIEKDGYYITKANDFIKVSEQGKVVQGGYDGKTGDKVNILRTFDQANGKTYLVDAPIQSSLQTVYDVLSDVQKDKFSMFFDLLNEAPRDFEPEILSIFTPRGINYCVSFFNSFNYTIYVPSNDAIQSAINSGKIKTWATINALPLDDRKKETAELIRFLRYHFQDRAVFIGQDRDDNIYDSSARKTADDTFPSKYGTGVNKYYKLGLEDVDGTIELTTESEGKARVIKEDGYYNLVAKDYVFNTNKDISTSFKNVDGTGAASAKAFVTSRVVTTSSAVIHLIDNVLSYK
jgi:hypothetical protein